MTVNTFGNATGGTGRSICSNTKAFGAVGANIYIGRAHRAVFISTSRTVSILRTISCRTFGTSGIVSTTCSATGVCTDTTNPIIDAKSGLTLGTNLSILTTKETSRVAALTALLPGIRDSKAISTSRTCLGIFCTQSAVSYRTSDTCSILYTESSSTGRADGAICSTSNAVLASTCLTSASSRNPKPILAEGALCRLLRTGEAVGVCTSRTRCSIGQGETRLTVGACLIIGGTTGTISDGTRNTCLLGGIKAKPVLAERTVGRILGTLLTIRDATRNAGTSAHPISGRALCTLGDVLSALGTVVIGTHEANAVLNTIASRAFSTSLEAIRTSNTIGIGASAASGIIESKAICTRSARVSISAACSAVFRDTCDAVAILDSKALFASGTQARTCRTLGTL